MAMFKPSQSHSGSVTVKAYTGNIAQELQFLTGENSKKTKPHFKTGLPQPSSSVCHYFFIQLYLYMTPTCIFTVKHV